MRGRWEKICKISYRGREGGKRKGETRCRLITEDGGRKGEKIHSRGEDRRLITDENKSERGKSFKFTQKCMSVKCVWFVWNVPQCHNYIAFLLNWLNNA